MSSQDKPNREATQRLQRGCECLCPLQIRHRDLGALLYEITRQPDATAKGAQPHDRYAGMMPGRRESRSITMVHVHPLIRVYPRPSSAASRRSVCTTGATSWTRTTAAP